MPMALPDPAWKIKTRLCPFYQRGACIFSERCNFIHDRESSYHAESARSQSPEPVSTCSSTPVRRLAMVNSPTFSTKSPRRSPRLSSLLAALKDVIGDEPEDVEDTFIESEDSITASPIHQLSLAEDEDATIRVPETLVNSKENAGQDAAGVNLSDASVDLLSPVELASLRLLSLGSLSRKDSGADADSIDSGYDSWSAPPGPLASSPPRSPATIPAPLGTPSFHLRSPGLNPFFPRSPISPILGSYTASSDRGYFVEEEEERLPLDLSLDSPTDRRTPGQELSTVKAEIPSHTLPGEEHVAPTVDSVKSHKSVLDLPSDILDSSQFLRRRPPPIHVRESSTANAVFADSLNDEEEQGEENALEETTVTAPPSSIPSDGTNTPSPGIDNASSPAPSQSDSSSTVTARPPVAVLADNSSHSRPSTSSYDSQRRVGFRETSPESSGDEGILSDEEASVEIAAVQYVQVKPTVSTAVIEDVVVNPFDAMNSDDDDESPVDASSEYICEHLEPEINDHSKDSSQDEDDSFTDMYSSLPPVTPEDVMKAEFRFPASDLLSQEVVEFDEAEVIGSSSMAIDQYDHEQAGDGFSDEEDEGESNMSSTAQLAYLGSPQEPENDDTLQSLYSVYNSARQSVSTPVQPLPEEMSPQIPQRNTVPVFTPPSAVSRGRSGTMMPSSLPPSRSQSPLISPMSDGKQSVQPLPSTVEEPIEEKSTTKVPFGFKHATLKRARNSIHLTDPALRIDTTITPPTSEPTTPASSSSNTSRKGLKPLRMSAILNHSSGLPFSPSSSSTSSFSQGNISKHSSIASINISDFSSSSSAHNSTLSARNSLSLSRLHVRSSSRFSLSNEDIHEIPEEHLEAPPRSAPADPSRRMSVSARVPVFTRPTNPSARLSYRPERQQSEPEQVVNHHEQEEETVRRAVTPAPIVEHAPVESMSPHAIATPAPDLLFAIASDDANEVKRVLEDGIAGPNEATGPQSALSFALTSDQLTHKLDIVKTLLAFGADPSRAKEELAAQGTQANSWDAATKYYVDKADASLTRRTNGIMRRSFFRQLARLRYGIIGQDRALEQLLRVLSIHSQQVNVAPIVILLCGPSGLGKSLLAQKFGAVLEVPTHTINMTTLRANHDLWHSYSISPIEPGAKNERLTLLEFLAENEGKRCVVVLDEIEKIQDPNALWSLLVPWELGQCSVEANSRTIDVRNVIWLGTSNIGQELILDHHKSRETPDSLMPREDYVTLMTDLRPRVSDRLGPNILSRVTTLLPFVPFTQEERRAIAAEALHSLSGDMIQDLSPETLTSIVDGAVADFVASEGARSLYRAVSHQLMDAVDLV